MYGKIFASMFDGSLYGNWQAIITLQQMIVLCDADGVVDMTPQAIAARTSIPLEIIQAGIETLEQPDKYSRTPDADGRRIERLDDHRPWGWRIVNHKKYRHLVDSETIREQNRERQRRHRLTRSVTLGHASVTPVTPGNGSSRHTEAEAEAEAEADPRNTANRSDTPQAQSDSSPSANSPPEPAVILLPLNTGIEHPITVAQVVQWTALFPAVDVTQQLRNMRAWLDASPKRRKTRAGILRFVQGWLAREQDRGGESRRPIRGGGDTGAVNYRKGVSANGDF